MKPSISFIMLLTGLLLALSQPSPGARAAEPAALPSTPAPASVSVPAPSPASPAQAQTAAAPLSSPLENRFREALFAEEARQDLKAAAEGYQEIIRAFDRDRAIAASALYRLAEVQRKENRVEEAIAGFRRVALEFPDREPLARMARENIRLLGGEPPGPSGGSGDSPAASPDPEQDKALARLKEMERGSPDLLLNPSTSLKSNGCLSYGEAIEAGYLRVLEFFLEHGASVDRTPDGRVPLAIAAEYGQIEAIGLLIGKGADINGKEGLEVPLAMAASRGHLTVARLLLDKRALVNGRRDWTAPLVLATEQGHKSVMELLLAEGADPGRENGRALISAVLGNRADLVALLLDKGASPDLGKKEFAKNPRRFESGQNPTLIAGLVVDAGSLQLPNQYAGYVQWMKVPKGLDADTFSPLHLACLGNRTEIAQCLIAKGADVNALSRGGSSPLELACALDLLPLGEMLVQAGAKGDRVTPGDIRLVDLALRRKSLQWYELLRKAGAVVSGQSPCGLTPLEVITEPGAISPEDYINLFARLLNDGADPNGNERFRPVVYAARNSFPKLIELLKSKGADFNPSGGMPPVAAAVLSQLADARSSPEAERLTIKALIDAGADLNRPFETAPDAGQELRRWSGMTPLAMLAASLPEVDSLDRFLAFHPLAQASGERKKTPFDYALDEYRRIRQKEEEFKAQQKNVPGVPGVRYHYQGFINIPGSIGGGDWESKVASLRKTAPATLRRLWEYEKVEQNPEFADRVWLQVLDTEKSPPRSHFEPVGALKSPVPLAEALVAAVAGTGLNPDFSKMEVLRRDPATGRPVPSRTLDLPALLQAQPPEAVPPLQPGEILSLQPTEQQIGGWRDFPEPVLTWIKASQTRRITVKAGEWVRAFQVLPELKGFRWDPATDVLCVKPTLQTVLRYLPKPAWYYRMAQVRVSRTGAQTDQKAVEIHDLTQPLSLDNDPLLPDGAEISLEEIPADDPDLVRRRKVGIFVSSPEDGFLREVFGAMEVPDNPSLPGITALNVIAAFYLESESVIPFPDMDALTIEGVPQSTGPLPDRTPGTGCTLELKRRRMESSPPSETEFMLDFSKIPPLSVQLVLAGQPPRDISLVQANGTFRRTADGWSMQRQRVHSPDVPWGMRGDISISSPSLEHVSARIFAIREENGRAWENVPRRLSRAGWPEPVAFRPWGGEMPTIMLRDGDRILLDPSDRRQGFRETGGQPPASVSPQVTPPSGVSRRRMVLPGP